MQEKPVKIFSFNPWKAHVGDCAIRAICAAIGMKYELVCKEFNVAWKNDQGLIRDTGIDLELIKNTFDEYFDHVEDYSEELPPELMDDPAFTQARFLDAAYGIDDDSSGITLAEFLELYSDQGTFLVGLVGNPDAQNPNARKGGHIVCAKCLKGKSGFAIDTWNSEEMLVDSFMRVKKTIPKDDPRHWVWDAKNKCFAGYGMEKKNKKSAIPTKT